MQKTVLVILMTISVIFGINTVYADDSIPAWVKGVAGFWVDGNITDAEFVEAIEFLIDSGIIQVDNYIKESIITEPSPPFTETQNFDRKNIIDAKLTYDDIELSALSKINIDFIIPQTQKIQEHIDFSITVSKDGETVFGPLPLTHTSTGSVTMPIEFNHGAGLYEMDVTVSGILFQPIPDKTKSFDVIVEQEIPSEISIHTDKSSYKGGETVKISGEITTLKIGVGLSYLIISPDNNIVTIGQLSLDGNNKFSHEYTTTSPLWDMEGMYTFEVHYGEYVAESKFNFSPVLSNNSISNKQPLPDFKELISYKIIGGDVTNIVSVVDFASLIISIDANSNGSITITIPRSVMDSTFEGVDDKFIVLMDGDEPNFTEIKTSYDRTLSIEFPKNAEDIEIIGSWIIS